MDNLKAFYGSRFSPNMTKTPEGFLICHNVPIARTGWQEYLGQELGLNDFQDKVVQVYRSPEEVFHPAAMASFEGKSVTDEHPPDNVRPDNYASYEKGQVTNVRRGSGGEEDMLLADLIVKDPRLISEVEHTKREVSCGYDCNYRTIEDGKYQQVDIRGNHVAVVTSGRAGSAVAIKDASPKPKDERRTKVKVDKNTIWGMMLSAFAKDAKPEELAEAAKMAPTEDNMLSPAPAPAPAAKAADEPQAAEPAIATLTKQVEALTAVISQLVESDKSVHAQVQPKSELDSLIAELETPAEHATEGEESVTLPAEKIADAEPGPTAPAAELPKNPIPGADRNTILAAIRAVKPIIAAIPDAGERKKASDALAKTFRDQMGTPPANPAAANGYAAIQAAAAANAKKTKDAKPDDRDLGREWARKHNPHYKEVK